MMMGGGGRGGYLDFVWYSMCPPLVSLSNQHAASSSLTSTQTTSSSSSSTSSYPHHIYIYISAAAGAGGHLQRGGRLPRHLLARRYERRDRCFFKKKNNNKHYIYVYVCVIYVLYVLKQRSARLCVSLLPSMYNINPSTPYYLKKQQQKNKKTNPNHNHTQA